jgi:hypothetical protein
VVAAVGVDVRVPDGAELREGVVADGFGLVAADVVEGRGEVAGVPGEDRVGDELEAEGVASVVVLRRAGFRGDRVCRFPLFID